jgi:integrase
MRLTIYIMLGTACRPEAAFDLTGAQLDFENRLIELNPHGRRQTKKIRPIVKMPEALAVILEIALRSHLIIFRGEPVKCVQIAWRNLRVKYKLDVAVQPYSLRHIMARHMRKSGAQLGKQPHYSVTSLVNTEQQSSMHRSIKTTFRQQRYRLMRSLMVYLLVTRQRRNPSSEKNSFKPLETIKQLERAMRFELTTLTLAR